ncbi:MAG TPA: T9SS type A sorting domain-containing protein [Hymenobacter sp.]|jgi:hypothetical protein|uniref:T9SS type A sorting domain-containing protein n=1 Tax=Hymenobacter sp. TaxID=1898978 RepID=UPI002ED9DED3
MAQKLVWVLLLSGFGGRACAQHEADTWYFGDRAGFSFRAGLPQVLLDGQTTTYTSAAVVSDRTTGQLLLYSDGARVWGRDHRVLPNGDGLWGSSFPAALPPPASYATQSALLVPVPGDTAGYYLFTLRAGTKVAAPPMPARTYASSLAYSLVDLRRNNGLGDVVPTTKNRRLATGLSEKLTAVRHANGRDYWVVCHEWLSNAFVVYPVTVAGVGPPARYALGPSQPTDTTHTGFQEQATGTLQASPDGRKLACGTLTTSDSNPPSFGLYDFDPATGAVAHYVNLGTLRDAYSPCFSPDNSKLYVPNFGRTPDGRNYNCISQFDLRAGDDAAVAASGQSIVVNNPATNVSATQMSQVVYQFQNGPDGRIYGASGYRSGGPNEQSGDAGNVFFVIGRPNARGFACEVRAQRFDFGGRFAPPALPNFMQHFFNGLEPRAGATCAPAAATLYPNPTTATFRVQVPGDCPQPYQLTLYDALGRRLLVRPAAEARPVEVAGLAAGWYVVELRFAQQVVIKKLVKL